MADVQVVEENKVKEEEIDHKGDDDDNTLAAKGENVATEGKKKRKRNRKKKGNNCEMTYMLLKPVQTRLSLPLVKTLTSAS